ncbi:arylacetamide deacetylase isoform X2 [Patella vulgata]|nr:arylacetamide deacetylase isoform X2 [Patella vulgata]XP_050410899.1 arylacetamide deacetylase isoform X2 [Patella vulgata]XP_050410907.1 arylacetamide deacetylase isoform X2 [Patella vulgata]XP_050410908.1 arylacetamide deacetylase isoform X2 [Patella vulgata]
MNMKCLQLSTIILPVIIALMVYFLYTPLPPDLKQKWAIQKQFAMTKIGSVIICMAEHLDYGSYINISRAVFDTVASGALNQENVTMTDAMFGKVPVTIFRPRTANDLSPALLYFHGGGWVFASTAVLAGGIADIAEWLNVVVVSVDYRLAPENPFPAPFDDCVTASVHLLHNGHRLGIDVNHIGVTGDSVGGNLAAAVALRLSEDTTLPKLKCQILIYPVLQAFDTKLTSYMENSYESLHRESIGKAYLWYLGRDVLKTSEQAILSNNHLTPALKKSVYYKSLVHQNLLPMKYRRKDTPDETDKINMTFAKSLETLLINPYIFPLMAKDLSKMPPSLIITSEYDILRDEGFMFAERLRQCGVKVQHNNMNAVHGFFFRPPRETFRYDSMLDTLNIMAKYFKQQLK